MSCTKRHTSRNNCYLVDRIRIFNKKGYHRMTRLMVCSRFLFIIIQLKAASFFSITDFITSV